MCGPGRMITAAVLAGLIALPAWGGAPYPFDDNGYLGDASLLPDWSATLARHEAQTDTLTRCLADAASCPNYYRGLRLLLQKAEGLEPRRQIKLINYYVNKRRYRNDRTTRLSTPLSPEPLRYRSRWATVEEFMSRGGDCEDYATTKYFLLRQLGFDAEQLRVVVTYDRSAGGYHALVAVRRDDGQVLLLESDGTVIRGQRHNFRFIYSVNEHSIWDHERKKAASRSTHPDSRASVETSKEHPA